MKQELLLSLLETNARYSTRDLADILLEDEDSVIHTMNELEKKKIICGIIPLSIGIKQTVIKSWR